MRGAKGMSFMVEPKSVGVRLLSQRKMLDPFPCLLGR